MSRTILTNSSSLATGVDSALRPWGALLRAPIAPRRISNQVKGSEINCSPSARGCVSSKFKREVRLTSGERVLAVTHALRAPLASPPVSCAVLSALSCLQLGLAVLEHLHLNESCQVSKLRQRKEKHLLISFCFFDAVRMRFGCSSGTASCSRSSCELVFATIRLGVRTRVVGFWATWLSESCPRRVVVERSVRDLELAGDI